MISSQANKTLSSSSIILSTLNARYIHSSLGLRYLLANMGNLTEQTRLLEYNINSRPIDIAEALLQQQPRIIGFGVYIWNVEQTLQVIKLIKTISPETIIILGGPEVSYEYDDQEIVKLADYLITGQADLAFGQICDQLLSDRKPLQKINPALPFTLDQIRLPYFCYTDEDMTSFAKGFNQLSTMQPHEIQVGILKRLKGSPIIRHTENFDMRFSPLPPYNILSNRLIDFETMQKLTRFARYWDMIANSGRFKHSLPLILGAQPFENFMQLSEWIYQTTQQTHKLALERLFKIVYQGLVEVLHVNATDTEAVLLKDFAASGLKGLPRFSSIDADNDVTKSSHAGKRQQRHLH